MPRAGSSRLLTALLALAPALGVAQHAVVSAEEVQALRAGKRPAVVIDARSPAEFAQGHIPGALNLPPELVSASVARLPKDKGAPLVFYCRGPG